MFPCILTVLMISNIFFTHAYIYFTVSCRMVIRAPLTPAWQQIKDNMCRLNPLQLNDKAMLKENGVILEKIEKGCLVIDVSMDNIDPLETNLQRIAHVLYEEGDVENVMQVHDTDALTIKGYIYNPEMYIHDDCSDTVFFLSAHYNFVNLHTKSF